jgi:gas vesicle protein GvpL/GvpF
MADRPEVWYVYGVVMAMPQFAHAPAGLDDASTEGLVDTELAAVASRLDGDAYAPAAVERGTADMEWLAPRAVAHDRVLTWASDRGPVVPFPMFSLFSNEDAVRAMLRERGPELQAALRRASEGREYALRVYRLDDELRTVAAELSPRLAELAESAGAASPGQRYLIERKLEAERKTELRAIAARVGQEILESLRPLATDAFTGAPVPRASTGGGMAENPLVLDAAFLIAPARLDAFRRELTAIIARHGSRGFRFDFTGPWPPYHFVQSVDRGNEA